VVDSLSRKRAFRSPPCMTLTFGRRIFFLKRINDMSKAKSKLGRRIAPSKWAEAEALYETGDWSIRKLAKHLDCRPETVHRHMVVKNIKKGSDAQRLANEMRQALEKKQREYAALKATRVVQTKNESVTIIDAIRRQVGKELAKSNNEKSDIGLREKAIKTLNAMVDTIKKCNDESYRLLEIKAELTTEELPELHVGEYTAEDLEAIERQQIEEAETYG